MNATDATPWQLAHEAGCASPDSATSPGALWLVQVAEAANEWHDYSDDRDDAPHQIVDGLVPIYTAERWRVFTDLAAWQEDVTEFGPIEDMEQAAGVALYLIGSRLATAVIEEAS